MPVEIQVSGNHLLEKMSFAQLVYFEIYVKSLCMSLFLGILLVHMPLFSPTRIVLLLLFFSITWNEGL